MASSSTRGLQEDNDSVDTCFVNAIEYVNRAHNMLLSPAPEAARKLARVSVDLSMIHREASELVDTSMMSPDFSRPPITPILPPGLYKDIENSESLLAAQRQGHEIVGPGYYLDPPLAPPQAIPQGPPQAISWAQIAARPEESGKGKALTSHGYAASNTRNAQASSESHMVPLSGESAASQQRVLFVKGCRVGTSLHDIAKQISQGPLMSISIGRNPEGPGVFVSIIFFDAEHARAFLRQNASYFKRNGHSLYGVGTTVIQGPLWPADEEIRAMVVAADMIRERRRLIFSGAGLFSRVSGTAFHEDLAAIAGDDNIELIWLYNMGNATAVFASTRAARAVLNELRRRALRDEKYAGAVITFATDPCEKEMRLATSVPKAAAVKRY
ncbi:hypothetical protein LPUS_04457 [Lasallia pustulata]|uniref:RRM domain-containing protein n=1 Tax=Lasallia pustulata TaxID=136370 RepID=A0A1W5CX26_9LECA|nr:hypothetical protein LPUS_04457 [Lasallia pustulata]